MPWNILAHRPVRHCDEEIEDKLKFYKHYIANHYFIGHKTVNESGQKNLISTIEIEIEIIEIHAILKLKLKLKYSKQSKLKSNWSHISVIEIEIEIEIHFKIEITLLKRRIN